MKDKPSEAGIEDLSTLAVFTLSLHGFCTAKNTDSIGFGIRFARCQVFISFGESLDVKL